MKYVPGEYKVIDENTGKEFYSGDLARDWDGSLRHRDNLDGEHPDYKKKRYPVERYPRLIVEPVVGVYVTAAVVFYAGTDAPRPTE